MKKPIRVVGLVRAKLRARTNAKLDALDMGFGPNTYVAPYAHRDNPGRIVAYGFGPAACTRRQARALRRVDTDDGLEGVRIIWSLDAEEATDGTTLDRLARRYGLRRWGADIDGEPAPPPVIDDRDDKLPDDDG